MYGKDSLLEYVMIFCCYLNYRYIRFLIVPTRIFIEQICKILKT